MSHALPAAAAAAVALALVVHARRRRRLASAETWEAHTCRLPAKLTAQEREAILAAVTLSHRAAYFELSSCPVTESVEQRMEQVSSAVSREQYNAHWAPGLYACARCSQALYSSKDKFVGPCMWPSFRKAHARASLHTLPVPTGAYNRYTCEVHELYCAGCHLFLGHQFADGAECGDIHPEAGWRHCACSRSR